MSQESAIKSATYSAVDFCINSYKGLKIIRSTDKQDRPCLTVFRGRSAKAIANYFYRSYEAREEAIRGHKKTADSHEEWDLKKKAERKAFTPSIEVGDVYHDMWGYDQTNNTFYEVIEKCSKHFAIIREIGYSYRDGGSFMSGYSKCEPGNYVGEPFKVKIQKSGCEGGQYIKVRGYSSATLLKDIETEFTDTNYA